MRKTLLVGALLFIAAVLPAARAQAASRFGPPAGLPASVHGSPYVPGELIVKFRAGLAPADRSEALRARGAGVERTLHVARTALVLAFTPRSGTAVVRRTTVTLG